MLPETLAPYRFILASGSPRRRALLQDSGIAFETAPAFGVEERYPETLPAGEVAAYLSALKAAAFPAAPKGNEIVITADTTVILGNEVLGKPENRDDAIAMLRRLSGRAHRVITGVTLRSESSTRTFSETSSVFFKTLSDEEIGYYVDRFEPYDKAGSYGIQEWIGYIGIERIEGCYYNIMGLPLFRLFGELETFLHLPG